MTDAMLEEAIEAAASAAHAYNTDKEVAQAVRQQFVNKYNGVWHCIVGNNFGAYTTYEQHHFCYFYVGQSAVLLFKTG
eukprot:CAMPEP_0115857574 /NCGR_PEP_ID=MMETSP0287-20121206/15645_1 /TAXON_ID=412157 /ORGANISM="Chrysochromulina rotalis, Strain UIO044" /LENGTH=77 /DNA_ID=CAMNT_0003311797 /DNA_START=119 /DNA_END=352 /DNA_ORIENTATION=+